MTLASQRLGRLWDIDAVGLRRDYQGRNRVPYLFWQPCNILGLQLSWENQAPRLTVGHNSGVQSQDLSEPPRPNPTLSNLLMLKVAFHTVNGIGDELESRLFLHLAGTQQSQGTN